MIYIIHTFLERAECRGQGAEGKEQRAGEGRGQRAKSREQRGKGDHFVFLQMFYKNLIYFL
jgi:hypothetical protein